MSDFKPGDRYNIAIDDARVEAFWTEGHDGDQIPVVQFAVTRADGAVHLLNLPRESDGISYERTYPSWWPPRPDDLLRDDHGTLWFTTAEGSNRVLVNSDGDRLEQPETAEQHHRLTLVHREEANGS